MSTHNSREEIKEIRKTIKDTFELMGQASGWVDLGIERICYLYDQELQKARHDWLREEIVKLEGEKLGGLARPIFVGANAPERMRIHNRALQTIIDRYQSELDQPITSNKTNGL